MKNKIVQPLAYSQGFSLHCHCWTISYGCQVVPIEEVFRGTRSDMRAVQLVHRSGSTVA